MEIRKRTIKRDIPSKKRWCEQWSQKMGRRGDWEIITSNRAGTIGNHKKNPGGRKDVVRTSKEQNDNEDRKISNLGLTVELNVIGNEERARQGS